MAVQLNHTIVHSHDPAGSAQFLAEVLDLDSPEHLPPFHEVRVANGVSLDFIQADDGDLLIEHYAFLVSEEEFDAIWGRIRERGLDWFADPHGQVKGEINTHDGGRGLYWRGPEGHILEIITVPYGGWPS